MSESSVSLAFERVSPGAAGAVVAFLRENDWPFHAASQLSLADAQAISVSDAATQSFWIRDVETVVGLVRLLDLDDVDEGAPLFDLRVAGDQRGRGVGKAAVNWLSDHLFCEYPTLHRIEASTRSDNAAMIAVLHRCGFEREGRLREAWKSRDGSRHDTMLYGLLRSDWSGSSSVH